MLHLLTFSYLISHDMSKDLKFEFLPMFKPRYANNQIMINEIYTHKSYGSIDVWTFQWGWYSITFFGVWFHHYKGPKNNSHIIFFLSSRDCLKTFV
jgi:hypothetical protein